jgi:hypothetical protein
MVTYEIIVSEIDNLETIKRTNEDGSVSWIPKDEANADYQAYLNPEAEQSTPIDTGDE